MVESHPGSEETSVVPGFRNSYGRLFRATIAFSRIGPGFSALRTVGFGLAAYAYATIYGLLTSFYFAEQTGLNPLAFFDAGDFVLAGVRHPIGLVVPIAAVLFIGLVGFVALQCFIVGQSAQIKKIALEKRERLSREEWDRAVRDRLFLDRLFIMFMWVAVASFAVAYLLVVPQASTGTEGKCARVVSIALDDDKTGAGRERTISRQLLDSTSRFLFVREERTGRVSAIAADAVESVTTLQGTDSRDPLCTLAQF